MINLIISGGNPVICKELAGHAVINISSNYYANIRNFVEVISFSKYRETSNVVIPNNTRMLNNSNLNSLNIGGWCASQNVAKRDYSDCLSGLSRDGKLLDCFSCKYYVADKRNMKINLEGIITAAKESERDMEKSFDGLLYAIENARKGLGYYKLPTPVPF